MIELGLQRISRLLPPTLLPWRAVHVAGTNGKGSICAYVSSMLETYNQFDHRESAKGMPIKHARFTSPHLVDRWDCITINQQPVDPSIFSGAERAVQERNEVGGIQATEFELLTATAFEIFTQERVKVAVVEVGMGGRLDATNIIGQARSAGPEKIGKRLYRPPPLVTAIAKIGLDHQAFLGSTLEQITTEKCGIIKPGVPVVYDTSNIDEVTRTIFSHAMFNDLVELEDLGAPLDTDVKRDFFANELALEPSETFAHIPEHTRRNISVAFRAAWLALRGLNRVPQKGEKILPHRLAAVRQLAECMIRNAASNTHIPGRLQNVSIKSLTGRKPDVLLDGAHNAQSAEVLALEVNKRRTERAQRGHSAGVTWVLAFSSTKDVEEILRVLLQPGDQVFAVEFGPVDGMPWVEAQASGKLVEAARTLHADDESVGASDCGRDLHAALRKASEAAEGGALVVAGSLYLVGDALRLLRDSQTPSG
ncbi:folylpolyglutamate synthase [Teratosphaeriaceae sp. CCFEE 6253]|nr:folylpolyglutamate synthase [Teratosphaeriaceae sp. CCFEE 6253]